MIVKPFLKWAGGKSQILSKIRNKYPLALGGEIDRYCEPFVGGGAVLFDVLSNYEIKEVLINDINAELVNVYRQIQENVDELINLLGEIERVFLSNSTQERKEFYYKKRDEFNSLKASYTNENVCLKAAIFIFLNKTCFNGLYRVNKKGFFNVPMGSYKNPLICDKENLIAINSHLQNVKITCGDFKDCLSFVDRNTFVYIDPPYRPLTKTASFTAYDETSFDDRDQIRLFKFAAELHKIGAKIVISNSDPKNGDKDDVFFDELYKSFLISRINAKRMINCCSESRGDISELLITNF